MEEEQIPSKIEDIVDNINKWLDSQSPIALGMKELINHNYVDLDELVNEVYIKFRYNAGKILNVFTLDNVFRTMLLDFLYNHVDYRVAAPPKPLDNSVKELENIEPIMYFGVILPYLKDMRISPQLAWNILTGRNKLDKVTELKIYNKIWSIYKTRYKE